MTTAREVAEVDDAGRTAAERGAEVSRGLAAEVLRGAERSRGRAVAGITVELECSAIPRELRARGALVERPTAVDPGRGFAPAAAALPWGTCDVWTP